MQSVTLILFLAALIGAGAFLGRMFAGAGTSMVSRAAAWLEAWAEHSPSRLADKVRTAGGSRMAEFPVLLLFGVILVAGLWAFFAILEDVIMGDGILSLDRSTHALFQSLRTPFFDRLLVALTELGDAKVVIPVAGMALALFAGLRRWREAAVLSLGIGGAALFVGGLKRVIGRARPVDIYDGVAEYSFPSGHAGMSIVVFGLLAFLLASRAVPQWRRIIFGSSIAFVLLIGFSRVYLGAHWLSDVLAGFAFGLAWNAIAAIVYLRRDPEPLPVKMLALTLTATLIIAGAVHIARDYPREYARYALPDAKAQQSKPGSR
jgi:membrane-associated phospholipid phosphatase